MAYKALYRTYRPTTFEEVAGQQHIVQTIKNALATGKIAHAYLFAGPRGTGKTTMAKLLAKALNCEHGIGCQCNECKNCVAINEGTHPDVLEIDAASNNSVDEVRDLIDKVKYGTILGRYKVYIIDEVHMMTPSAFNALLKTLEEPPAHIIFILATTEPHKIPTTIISRCQRFDFKKLRNSDIVERLKYIVKQEKIDIDDISLEEIARISNGGMRDAINILDQVNAYANNKITVDDIHEINGTLTPQAIKQFIESIIDKDLENVFKLINEYDENGKDFIKITEELLLYLRNILFKLNTPNYFKTLNLSDSDYDINISNEQITMYVEKLNNMMSNLKKVNNPKLIFELTMINLMGKETKIINEPEKKVEIKQEKEPKKEEKPVITKINYNKENLKKLQKIRVNNTLCNFDKKEYIKFKEKIEEINRLIIDPEYNTFASIVLDGNIKAVGKENLIFVFENVRGAESFNANVKKIDEMFNYLYNNEYKSIAVDKTTWEKIKQEFNSKQKQYSYIEEPSELVDAIIDKKNDNNIEDTFGNIVEYS